MYYICQNIDFKIIEGSEILNPALDAKCTSCICQNIDCKIIEGLEVLNPPMNTKCTASTKILLATFRTGQKFRALDCK